MRGRVTFEVAGQSHALHFTVNRLCQLEEDTGQGVIAHLAKLDDPENIKFTDLRAMFRAGLEGNFSRDEAGAIMQDIGLKKALVLVTQAMSAAFDITDANAGIRPGKAKAGAA